MPFLFATITIYKNFVTA